MTTANLWAALGPEVYRLWSTYWLAAGWAPPPIRLAKPTMTGGAVFHVPLASPWVRQFVEAHQHDPVYIFENQGEELPSSDVSNLGTWGSFSAVRRSDIPQPLGRPVLPQALPTYPSPADLREIRRMANKKR